MDRPHAAVSQATLGTSASITGQLWMVGCSGRCTSMGLLASIHFIHCENQTILEPLPLGNRMESGIADVLSF